MNVQYLSNDEGKITAVQLPIKDWERLRNVYPNIDNIDSPLPDWQKELLDKRLQSIEEHPERLKPISGLIELLDSTEE
ncbi:MAG: addiction module protein [Mucilaginibacter sp.]